MNGVPEKKFNFLNEWCLILQCKCEEEDFCHGDYKLGMTLYHMRMNILWPTEDHTRYRGCTVCDRKATPQHHNWEQSSIQVELYGLIASLAQCGTDRPWLAVSHVTSSRRISRIMPHHRNARVCVPRCPLRCQCHVFKAPSTIASVTVSRRFTTKLAVSRIEAQLELVGIIY